MAKTIDLSPFLESLPDMGNEGNAAAVRGTANAPTGVRDSSIKPVDRILTSLASGPKPLKELILPGEQFSDLLTAVQQLQTLGYVEHQIGDDSFRLTTSGLQAKTATS